MARYSDTLTQQKPDGFPGDPIAGALVYVRNQDGTTPALTDNTAQPLANPVTTDKFGGYSFNAASAFYDLQYYFGGRMISERLGVPVGVTDIYDEIDQIEGQISGLQTQIDNLAGSIGGVIDPTNPQYYPDGTGLYTPLRTGVGKLQESVSLRDFKANADTDWTNALIRHNRWARGQSLAGRGVHLFVPPGLYQFDNSLSIGCWLGIKDLHVEGYGATFQNTHLGDGYGIPFHAAAQPALYTGHAGGPSTFGGTVAALINTAAQGGTSVVCTTVADAALFAVGDDCLIACLDIQYYGYPPNPYYFDFVKVSAVNTSTGTINFAGQPLRYDMRSTYPDSPADHTIGKARIIRLNRTQLTDANDNGFGQPLLCYRAGDQIPWDVRHVYEGMTIGPATVGYITQSGRDITWRNVTAPGYAESVCGSHRVIAGRMTTECEPDKIVKHSVYEDVTSDVLLTFQSASIENVEISGSFYALAPGQAKRALIKRADCRFYSPKNGGGQLGLPVSHTLLNVTATGHTQFQQQFGPYEESQILAIDGTIVSYANGIISVRKADGNIGALSPVPGGKVQLVGASGGFITSDIGQGVILDVYDDATFYRIKTTLKFATLPSWAVNIARVNYPAMRYENCTGTDDLRIGSEATRMGRQPGEYRSILFAGAGKNANLFISRGRLERLRVRVFQPAASAMTMAIAVDATTASAVDDQKSFAFVFDLTQAGVRDYSFTALTGKVGADTAKLGGADITALPYDRWMRSTLNVTFSAVLTDTGPVVELEWWTDQGILRRRITTTRDDNTQTLITGIAGTLL